MFGTFICSLFSQSSTSSTLRFPELWMPLYFKYSFNQGTGLQWKLLAAGCVRRNFFWDHFLKGVTTSRATSGGWRKDRNTSGQRGNKFSTSYRDISAIVTENNSVVKPKYQHYTLLNKMLSNFSKVLMAHISFTAVINNRGIGKGIDGIRKGTKKNYTYVL